MNNTRIEADIRSILSQGRNPVEYANGLAAVRGVSREVVEAAIAAVAGTPRVVDAETVAQERLVADRRMHPVSRLSYNHEQE